MAQEGKTQETNNNLLEFNWEDDGVDFFGIKGATDTPPKKEEETTQEEETQEETTEETQEETQQVEETNEEDFFGSEGQTEEESEETEETTTGGSDNYWNDVYSDFKNAGLFKHIEIEEGEELDSDKLFELQQEEYETEVSSRLKAWASEELDEDARAFIAFKRDGGNTADFFKTYQNSYDIPTGDIGNEDYQDNVIRYQLAQEDWDRDEIEDRLKYLTESGKKEAVAKKYDKRIKEQDNKQKQALLKQAETQKREIKAQEESFKQSIKSVLDETQDVSGVKITPKDKTQLYNFLTKKQHKVSETKSITGFQKKLAEVFQDTEKMILLAKLVNSDFDMSDIKKATVTKKTQQIKSNLEQRKNLRPSNSGSSLQGSSLADLF